MVAAAAVEEVDVAAALAVVAGAEEEDGKEKAVSRLLFQYLHPNTILNQSLVFFHKSVADGEAVEVVEVVEEEAAAVE